MRQLIEVLINDRSDLLVRLDRNDESFRSFNTSLQQLNFWYSQMHEVINSVIEIYSTTQEGTKELTKLVIEKFNGIKDILDRIVRVD